MKRGTILKEVSIDRLGHGGIGIGQLESGKKVLIKGGLPGSVVDCKVIKNKKDYCECHIVTVHTVEQEWIDGDARCPHYVYPYHKGAADLPEHKKGCGGCKRQAVSYTKQLALKNQIVQDAFARSGLLDGVVCHEIIGSPLQYLYRNKIEFSFGKYLKRHPIKEDKTREPGFAMEHHWNLGFHKQGEFSKVVGIDQCYLVSEKMHSVYKLLKADLEASGLPVYDVKQHSGLLRHLIMREGVRTGQLLVGISLASSYLEGNKKQTNIWKKLLKSWEKNPEIMESVTTLVLIHNDGLADIVNGRESRTEVVRGPGHIFEGLQFEDKELIRFQVSPFSFFQTNTSGAEVLFSRAAEMIGGIKGNVIDLYCGSGSIGLSFLQQGIGKAVHGIDIVPSAIYDAEKNARINGLEKQAYFHCGKAEDLLKQGVIDDECFIGKDLIVIDPPRQGLHKDVVAFLGDLRKKHPDHTLLYISCNPVTMVRDIGGLVEGGYTLHELQPVDMFPHTHHIECIGVLK